MGYEGNEEGEGVSLGLPAAPLGEAVDDVEYEGDAEGLVEGGRERETIGEALSRGEALALPEPEGASEFEPHSLALALPESESVAAGELESPALWEGEGNAVPLPQPELLARALPLALREGAGDALPHKDAVRSGEAELPGVPLPPMEALPAREGLAVPDRDAVAQSEGRDDAVLQAEPAPLAEPLMVEDSDALKEALPEKTPLPDADSHTDSESAALAVPDRDTVAVSDRETHAVAVPQPVKVPQPLPECTNEGEALPDTQPDTLGELLLLSVADALSELERECMLLAEPLVVGDSVALKEALPVAVDVADSDIVGVPLGVGVPLRVPVGEGVALCVGVPLRVPVGVGVGVPLRVPVGVGVGVGLMETVDENEVVGDGVTALITALLIFARSLKAPAA